MRRSVLYAFRHDVKVYHLVQEHALEMLFIGLIVVAYAYYVVIRTLCKQLSPHLPRQRTKPGARLPDSQRGYGKPAAKVCFVERREPFFQLPYVNLHRYRSYKTPLKRTTCARFNEIVYLSVLSEIACMICASISSHSSGLSFSRVLVASRPWASLLPW